MKPREKYLNPSPDRSAHGLELSTLVPRAGRQVANPLASLHEKQRTQIQDMLPQQYYKEKVHIFNT